MTISSRQRFGKPRRGAEIETKRQISRQIACDLCPQTIIRVSHHTQLLNNWFSFLKLFNLLRVRIKLIDLILTRISLRKYGKYQTKEIIQKCHVAHLFTLLHASFLLLVVGVFAPVSIAVAVARQETVVGLARRFDIALRVDVLEEVRPCIEVFLVGFHGLPVLIQVGQLVL